MLIVVSLPKTQMLNKLNKKKTRAHLINILAKLNKHEFNFLIENEF